MDVFIKNEYPQTLGTGIGQQYRTFFMLGATVNTPTLTVSLDNTSNTVYITSYDSSGNRQNVTIDNVPIRTPFRIGISKSPRVMVGFLNGKLVQTTQLRSTTMIPMGGNIIFSPANIVVGGVNLAQNILVLNLRTFGYTVSTSEMSGRMSDLAAKSTFIPSPSL
jgi:hypothetical protein